MGNKEKNFEFRDFLYLDKDLLESFTAQKYKGFPMEMHGTHTKQEARENVGEKINHEKNLDGMVGLGGVGVTGSSKTATSGEQVNQNKMETSQGEFIKVEKENMFHDFMKYLKQNNLFTDISNPDIGKYVDLYKEFYCLDFDRIQKLCNENYLTIYQSTISSDEFTKENFGEIRKNVALLKEFIPYDILLYNRGYIVLIDKQWLRIKKENLGYLLGEKINVVGKVSKFIQVDEDMPDVIKILNKIQKFAIAILSKLGFDISDKVFLIIPVAIYH